MDKFDFQPYIDAACERYDADCKLSNPYCVCVNDTGAEHRNYDDRAAGGAWVQAWVWVPNEEAVKARLLRGSEE